MSIPSDLAMDSSLDKLPRQSLIIDGDDTLWPCQELYDRAKSKFSQLMEKHGYDGELAILRYTTIRLQMVREHGFSESTFYMALLRAYSSLCKDKGVCANMNTQNDIHEICMSIYASPTVLYSEVRESLCALRERNYLMILLSAGQRMIQQDKVYASGVGHFFDAVEIVGAKDAGTFEALAQKYNIDPSTSFSIGNSMRSDIEPALKAGFSAIHIKGGTWAYDKAANLQGLSGFGERYRSAENFVQAAWMVQRLGQSTHNKNKWRLT